MNRQHGSCSIRGFVFGLLVALGWGFPGAAPAQILEDIELSTDQGVAEIRLHFAVPVQYIKHFPAEHGQLIKLYLQGLSLESIDEYELQEYKHTPYSPKLPPFTVFYTSVRNCFAVSNPLCLDIQFRKPVHFRIQQGADSRSILLYVLPDAESPTQPNPHTPAR